MPRLVSKLQAGVATAALLAISAAPAAAAPIVAQATATGLIITVLDNTGDSGTYKVTHDGETETATGENRPAITVLGDQDVINAGTIFQDAITEIRNGDGLSAACAGLAGDGATLVAAGEGFCIAPGDNLTLNAGTVDLTDVVLIEGVSEELQTALGPLLDPVLAGLSDGLAQALEGTGGALTLDLGAIQSQCVAEPGSASGDSQLVDASLNGSLGGQDATLVEFPVSVPPNTKL
ncbi:MAG: hypothetical protein M3445_03585, partial [Actinomycetota bacterium]|nr:hypothetical protein [Actinomycetota bacterium]